MTETVIDRTEPEPGVFRELVRGPLLLTLVREDADGEKYLRAGRAILARYRDAQGNYARPTEKIHVEYDFDSPLYRRVRLSDSPDLLARAVSIYRPQDFAVERWVPVSEGA